MTWSWSMSSVELWYPFSARIDYNLVYYMEILKSFWKEDPGLFRLAEEIWERNVHSPLIFKKVASLVWCTFGTGLYLKLAILILDAVVSFAGYAHSIMPVSVKSMHLTGKKLQVIVSHSWASDGVSMRSGSTILITRTTLLAWDCNFGTSAAYNYTLFMNQETGRHYSKLIRPKYHCTISVVKTRYN